jgi:acetate---CoA ligase (ADP-forming) subunit beta
VTSLSEWDSKRLLGAALPTPRETLTRSVEDAVAFAQELGGPVVLKASGVAHKTERGLVRVGLAPAGVRAAWQELAAGGDGTVLVAEEIRGDFELMAGGLRDPQFGPLVTIGLGGTLTEVLADVAFLLAPPEPGELEVAVRSLRSAALFSGYRGRPAPEGAALEAVVASISDLLLSRPDVAEIDCNPIIVRDGAVFVVDALVVRS